MPGAKLPEPWLRGTLTNLDPVPRAVLHALELAKEDIERFCGSLSDTELNSSLFGLPSVAFHIKHIARSLDRLLTYAEGDSLNANQLAALKSELDKDSTGKELFAEFDAGLLKSAARIRNCPSPTFGQARAVGKKQLPTTVAGLLVHIADHTQRHVGQAVTTAKLILAQRSS